jgi:hypothetical protein
VSPVTKPMVEDAFRKLADLDALGRCHFVARQDGRSNRAMNQAIVARFAASLRGTASREGTEFAKTAGLSGNRSGNGCRIRERRHAGPAKRSLERRGHG